MNYRWSILSSLKGRSKQSCLCCQIDWAWGVLHSFLSLCSYLYSQSLCFNVTTQWEMVALWLEVVDLRKKLKRVSFWSKGEKDLEKQKQLLWVGRWRGGWRRRFLPYPVKVIFFLFPFLTFSFFMSQWQSWREKNKVACFRFSSPAGKPSKTMEIFSASFLCYSMHYLTSSVSESLVPFTGCVCPSLPQEETHWSPPEPQVHKEMESCLQIWGHVVKRVL